MFGHLPELFIVLVIALIVFGPEKLPEVAANAGKIMREFRQVIDTAMNPEEHVPDDFSTYYYESLSRAGEDVPPVEEPYHEEDDEAYLLRPDEPAISVRSELPKSDPLPPAGGSSQEDLPHTVAHNGNHPDDGAKTE